MNFFCGSTDWENLVEFKQVEIEILKNCNKMCTKSVADLIVILKSPSYLFRSTRDTIYKALYLIERLKHFYFLPSASNQNLRDIALKLKDPTHQNPISRELREQFIQELTELQTNIAEIRHSLLAAATDGVTQCSCTAPMNSDGKLKQSVVDELLKLGVTSCGMHFDESKETFMVRVTGNVDESEFQNQLSLVESLQGLNITYEETDGNVSDDTIQSGGVLEYSSLTASVFHGIDLPYREIFQYFDVFGKPELMNNSTVGCILKVNNQPYLLTAAHCLFKVSLSDDIIEKTKRQKLNRDVKFAIYHHRIDACLFPCLSSTVMPSLIFGASSSKMNFNLGNANEWTPERETKGLTVFKIGYKTGLTFGTFEGIIESVDIGGNNYENVVKVKSKLVGYPFTAAGDSGAIYYLIDGDNEIRPIAIHRASDKVVCSYGSVLSDCISNLLTKLGLPTNDVRIF
mmetsp:Transcript_17877/g.24518  ORF Transcript_17877/g.24518 Transcript_17877/m.24518 type:complete len:458 (+) Transcript_17877:64-1437(+)